MTTSPAALGRTDEFTAEERADVRAVRKSTRDFLRSIWRQNTTEVLVDAFTTVFLQNARLAKRIAELERRRVAKYCGVWSRHREYEAGDQVTVAGSLWIAKGVSQGCRPTSYPAFWTLCVKQGRA